MPSTYDTQLGQLALARGMLGLGQLLRVVGSASEDGLPLRQALVDTGTLTPEQLAELDDRLTNAAVDDLLTELEQGQTIVVEEIRKSRADDADAALAEGLGAQSSAVIGDIDLDLAHDERYDIGGELGRGGMGRVLRARDRILAREVALKQLVPEARNEKGRGRLLLEAQVTGLLEHPSIVPVYDLRAATDGEPFYTMRMVQEQSLEHLLLEIREGRADYSLTHLVTVLRQVSLAIQYAHDRGVVHRDLKPENILVGRYGEVYVIDWGIAKIVRSEIGLNTTGQVVMMGALVGTPSYMAPEQARGDNEAVDARTDVYGLGAILYEILALRPPFEADHVLAILFQVVNEPPERPSDVPTGRPVPSELEEVCLRALRKDPERRYQSAQQFADELDLFIEGVKEKDRRRQAALAAMEEASQMRAIYDDVRLQYAEVVAQRNRERDAVESWAPAAAKKDLWSLEQQAEDLEVEMERRFGETIRIYGQALVHEPTMPEARRALAGLYWERFRESEASGRLAQAAYFEGLVRQYNDGAYDRLLEGTATLSLGTMPSGADATLFRFQQVERRLVEWRVAELGKTPVHDVQVAHGSYVFEISRPGCAAMNLPVLVERGSHADLNVTLWPESAVPEGFVVVAGGPFLSGKLSVGGKLASVEVDDFAIGRFPITCAEYREFLNGLLEVDPGLADRHAPRDKDRVYWPKDENGHFVVPERDPEGDSWHPDWPVIMVNLHDAMAYAKWRSDRDGVEYRLPTAEEWEKAARGVDGRIYSWGNHFDASFCLMRASTKGRSLPLPVGSFPIDRSPYGMMDACGNVVEWTASAEPGTDDVHYLCGASYNSFEEFVRLDLVMSSPADFNFAHYGFRLAVSLQR